jgi:hypothetical protein
MLVAESAATTRPALRRRLDLAVERLRVVTSQLLALPAE